MMIRCPRCKAPLMAGPQGGASQNFYCTDRERCRQGFNMLVFDGMIFLQEDIGEVDDERFRMYVPSRNDD